MKNCYTLLIVLISSLSFGQNWKLIDKNKTYFYKHSDSLLITNTIKIDSTVNSVLDSVFHIHTTIKICDTCTVIPSDAVGGVLYHAYAPEIFGNTLIYNVSTSDYQFSNGIIKHDAELSDNWVFNASLSINATVVDKYETTLFGSLDSVKVIELSTLDTILISKYHGVIRYPDFENIGKYFLLCGFHEGQNSYGEYLPNMWRIYDFNVGDEFFYYNDRLGAGTYESYIFHFKIKILENVSSEDTVKFRVKIIGYSNLQYLDTDFHPVEEFITYLNFETILSSLDHKAIIENNYGPVFMPSYINADVTDENYHFYLFTNVDYNIFSHYMLKPEVFTCDEPMYVVKHEYDGQFGYKKKCYPYSKLSDSLIYHSGYNFSNLDEMASGIGKLYNYSSCFEYSGQDDLLGYIKGTDTLGSFYNFPDDLSINQEPTTSILIYPNPANTEIHLPENLQRISFFNLSGQQVLSTENPNQTIFIGDLPKGIYMLQAIDANGNLSTTKMIIE